MSSILFHGTPYRTPIEQIDPSYGAKGMDEYGKGFYARPVGQWPNRPISGVESVQGNAGWNSGGGGIVYGIQVPEDFDGYSRQHQQRFLQSSAKVDQATIDRITESMRKIGKDPVTGTDFSAKADELESRLKKSEYSPRNLVKMLQSELGVEGESRDGRKTSTDIFRGAGISGMYNGTNDSVVILDAKSLPPPKAYGAYFPGNADANKVGSLFDDLNQAKGLPENTDRALRKMALEASLDTEQKNPAAYDKVRALRAGMESSGIQMTPEMKIKMVAAEDAAARASGISPEQVQMTRKAQDLVDRRPPRVDGEGFEHYKDRVYEWYDKTNPKATDAQNKMFNSALHDTWYREAQHHYAGVTGDALAIKNDPLKVERMLLNQGTTHSRDMLDIAHIESDAGRYHSTPQFESLKRSPGFHYKAAGVGVLGVLGAGAAAAAQPNATAGDVGRAVADSVVPGSVAASKGQTCKAFGQAAGSVAASVAVVTTAPPAATAALAVTAASGPFAPVVGPLATAGAVVGVGAAGAAADHVVSEAAEAACNAGAKVVRKVQNALGF